MPPRIEPPGLAFQVTHRGAHRAPVFLDHDDFANYRACLGLALHEHGVALHAYVLMSSHVQLLLTVPAPGRLACAMRRVDQRYVAAFNRRHGRTGTPWEDRFRSRRLDSGLLVLEAQRAIEGGAGLAALVTGAGGSSSAHASLASGLDPLVTPHPAWLALGADRIARCAAWSRWLRDAIGEDPSARHGAHGVAGEIADSASIQDLLARTRNERPAMRPRGRPRKAVAAAIGR